MLADLSGYFSARADVTAAWLYGSEARGEAGPSSDVDVAVLFRETPPSTLASPVFAVEGDLERRIGRTVHVVAANTSPCDLVHRVLRDGILVADTDRSARVRFEVRMRNEYFDMEPVRRRFRHPAP